MRIDEIIGYAGMVLILLAYYMVSTKKVKSQSYAYQSMNFFGALFLSIKYNNSRSMANSGP